MVVRGKMGHREHYRPIVTPLAASAAPAEVARGLKRLAPFGAFYLADLDAIAGGAPDQAAIDAVAACLPGCRLWIDAGLRDEADVLNVLSFERTVAVIGSETLGSADTLQRLRGEPRVVLSLDFRGAAFLGAPEVLENADLWPQAVIVMTLAKVGSGAGPELETLAAIQKRAGGRRVYAAGGVRGPQDLKALADLGIAGVLVASALHDGRLDGAALQRFMPAKPGVGSA